ncbi:hypothetical protein GCM10020254_34670 [Streptomyces goshikiensis]
MTLERAAPGIIPGGGPSFVYGDPRGPLSGLGAAYRERHEPGAEAQAERAAQQVRGGVHPAGVGERERGIGGGSGSGIGGGLGGGIRGGSGGGGR